MVDSFVSLSYDKSMRTSKSLNCPRNQREHRFQAGQEIAALIEHYGISKQEIAKKTGINPYTARSIGLRIPSISTLDKISGYVAKVARDLRRQKRKPKLKHLNPKKLWKQSLMRAARKPLLLRDVDLLAPYPDKYILDGGEVVEQIKIHRELEEADADTTSESGA